MSLIHNCGLMARMSDPSVESIRSRLRKFQGKYPDICERADLQYSWLSKFASGERGKRPSFDLMTRLSATLDELERELELEREQKPNDQPPTD